MPIDPQFEFLLWALAGALLASAVMGLVLHSRVRAARRAGAAEHEPELARLSHEVGALQRRFDDLRERFASTDAELSSLRSHASQISAERAALSDRSENLAEDRSRLQLELEQARARALGLTESNASLQSQLREQARSGEEKLALLQQAEARLRESFENLAQRILDERAAKLSEQSKLQIGGLVEPLREQLKAFGESVAKTYAAEQHERGMLSQQIESLKQLNQRISEDAINLTRALKGESQTQGAWGELILERVLEASGLQAGREYEIQTGFQNEDGGRPRPDVVVRLPENRALVIDAKVSLVAYDRLVGALDDSARASSLRDLLVSIRRHIDGLSGRRYEDLPQLESLDFVLMFIPMESAFIEAVRADPELYQYGLQRNISMVSPSTLLATLRTVTYLWKLERQNQNAQEIARRGAMLHDNFVLLVEEIEHIGVHIEKARNAHGSAVRRLTEGGKGSVLLQVKSLADMGAPAKKRLPEELLGEAMLGVDVDETSSSAESPSAPES